MDVQINASRRLGVFVGLLGLTVSLAVLAPGCGSGGGENNTNNGEAQGPVMVSSDPVDGAVDVATSARIKLVFDRELDRDSLEGEITLEPALSGSLSYDSPSRTVTFRPTTALARATSYTVSVSRGIKDEEGRALRQAYSFSFTTAAQDAIGESTYSSNGATATVTVVDAASDQRDYTMVTTAELRDNDPPDKKISFSEEAGQPILRSGNLMFDALFAMSIEEMRQNAVSQISDGAFNNGQGVACDCFETGAKWNYVWTRDTAYAVDLGLAIFDPARSRNSLDFKLSERKSGGDLQIVQDTGSGGSWPVSSDRVVWAIGAWEALKFLDGSEREAFRDRALEAMANTIELDRRVVYDARDGLYRGEQSFLDWREQSYPSWTAGDTVHLAMSKALSTNVGHLAILRVASELATETGDSERAERFGGWADDLSAAINRELWLEEMGMYSTLKTTELDPAPLRKVDLLGESLAVLWEIADSERASSTVNSYPHSTMGPPVLWPQQPRIPIYHNRGIWPFVTAYGLLAARKVGNDAVFDHDLESLIRGAALNLSNMENFEFLTQKPWVDDGEYSGPVVNSRRQLWSVAGYFGAIVKGVFGLEASQQGIRVKPFLTHDLRHRWFAGSEEVSLRQLSYRGKTISIRLVLPAEQEPVSPSGGAYPIEAVTLNGQPVELDTFHAPADLGEQAEFVVTFADGPEAASEVTVIEDTGDFKKFWAPIEPNLSNVSLQGEGLQLEFDANGEQGVRFNIFRDGEQIASDLAAGPYLDEAASPGERSHCYAVESFFPDSKNHSHHSQPVCYWGAESQRVRTFTATRMLNQGGQLSDEHGRVHFGNWGAGDHSLRMAFYAEHSGLHYLQLVHGNGAGAINTGITASVKEVIVTDTSDDTEAARGTIVMPHLGYEDWARWADSSLLSVSLEAGKLYRVQLVDDLNMSYFAHFQPYTGGQGGGDETYNAANIHALKLLAVETTTSQAPPAGLGLDGSDDLAKLEASAQITPGANLDDDSRFALQWDEHYLYLVLSSPAFAQPFVPWMVYLQSGAGDLDAPAQGTGTAYSMLSPQLPFTPDYLVAARAQSIGGDMQPYNGIWRPDGQGGFRQMIAFEEGVYSWMGADGRTMALKIPRALLGAPSTLRLAAHVVYAEAGEEWKALVPASHTPWMANGSGFYSFDLRQATPAASAWSED